MLDDQPDTTPWALAHARLTKPEPGRTSWLATVRPDGSPHLMPIIAVWIEGAFHFIVGEGTRKGRNLSEDGRCVVATGSTTLPSLDVVVEGYAEPLADEAEVRRIAKMFAANDWPLEAHGDRVDGPNAPTAGPPPYAIYRMVPSKAFGLPGMLGMEQYDRADLPKPTRWEFDGA
jgi:nitroimidazol reductase NimA-like FMN-containing flavoprotein (pyridoxamine 5'-phosphate oxidase superfamily)